MESVNVSILVESLADAEVDDTPSCLHKPDETASMRDVDKQPETTADAIKRGGDGQRQGDDAQGNMIPATKGGSTKSDGKRGDSEIKLKGVPTVTQRLMDGLARKELRP